MEMVILVHFCTNLCFRVSGLNIEAEGWSGDAQLPPSSL